MIRLSGSRIPQIRTPLATTAIAARLRPWWTIESLVAACSTVCAGSVRRHQKISGSGGTNLLRALRQWQPWWLDTRVIANSMQPVAHRRGPQAEDSGDRARRASRLATALQVAQCLSSALGLSSYGMRRTTTQMTPAVNRMHHPELRPHSVPRRPR